MSTSTLTDVGKAISAPFGLTPAIDAVSKGDITGALKATGTAGVGPALRAAQNRPSLPEALRATAQPDTSPNDALRSAAAAQKARTEELRKRGRVASILTGPRGDLRTAPLGRPTVGGGQLGL